MRKSKVILKLMTEYGMNLNSTYRANSWIVNFWFEEEAIKKTHVCSKSHKDENGKSYKCEHEFKYTTDRSVTNGIAEFGKEEAIAYGKLEKRFLNHLVESIKKARAGKKISSKEFPKAMIRDIEENKFYVKMFQENDAPNAYENHDERDIEAIKKDMAEPQIDSDEYYEWDADVKMLEDWLDEELQYVKETTDAMRRQREEAKNIWELHPRRA
jgi:hypothetical protein